MLSSKIIRYMKLTGYILLLLAIFTLLTGCEKKKETVKVQTEPEESKVPVGVEIVAAKRITEVARIPVTLAPRRETNLSFKIAGKVREVLVAVGDQVKAGDVLAQLDDTDLRNQILQAKTALAVAEANLRNTTAGSRPENIAISQAQLQQAETNLELQQKELDRMRELFAEELISKQQYDAAVAAYRSAEAQVKVARESLALTKTGPSEEMVRVAEAQVQQARVGLEIAESQLENLVLKAPISGCITQVKINVGEMASPGVPVIGIADLSQVYAVGYVGQSLINRISPGEPVTVAVRMNGVKDTYAGTVEVLSRTVDQVYRAYEFKIAIENRTGRLKGGMVGEATFVTRESNAGHPVIPRDAVLEENGEKLVFVIENNRAVARSLTLGVDNGQEAEVLTGLQIGETLVTSGHHLLRDGMAVEVKE